MDGTLSPAERHDLEAWAHDRPDVARRVAAQRRVATQLRMSGPDVPPALLNRVQARVETAYGASPARAYQPSRRRPGWPRIGRRTAIPVAALAAVALAVVIGLQGGGGPSITGAAALAYAPATAPPPQAQSATLLDVSYGGVTYPNYQRQFDAIPTGRRTDRLGGRAALTVFYRLADGTRLSYTVFSGHPVPLAQAAHSVVYGGIRLRVFRTAKLAVVTLVRFGRTCVLAAPTTPDRVLALALAPLREQAA